MHEWSINIKENKSTPTNIYLSIETLEKVVKYVENSK